MNWPRFANLCSVSAAARTNPVDSLKKRQCHRLLMMLRWKDVVLMLVASSSKADGTIGDTVGHREMYGCPSLAENNVS